MNKHQRKRSKRVKSWMRILNCYGYDVTYKQARRRMRTLDRKFDKWVRVGPRNNPLMFIYLNKPWRKEENDAD